MTKALRYALVVGSAIASILLFLLASASDNSGFLDRYFSWLLGLNVAVAGALLLLVIVYLARLYSRYKAGRFGSRLMARLVLLFAGIGILPGLVIFMVSVQFVSHSIESWFDVKIEAALDSGLKLGQAALDEALSDLGATAGTTAVTLAGQPDGSARIVLMRTVDDGMQSAMLLDAEGKLLASASEDHGTDLSPDVPTEQMLKQAAMPGGYARIEGGIDRSVRENSGENGGEHNGLDAATGLRLRVVIAVPEPPGVAPRYLQLLQGVPVNLASNAEVISTAYSEYRDRKFGRTGLRKMYIGTLTLTLLLAIFGAIGSAFLIAGNLAQPLLVLAEGTRAVAEGDLSPRPIVETSDELGTLTQSFNAMTGQLFEARSAVERNRAALESAKAHLESVLANMSAGVIVLDADGVVVNSNDAVHRILQVDIASLAGRPLDAIDGLESFAGAVTRAFSAQSAAQSAQSASGRRGPLRSHWQQQIEIPRRPGTDDDHDITVLARGSRLPVGAGSGFIVVFDDISDVISAQRSVAWGEVARRLAHEIKNPLTPIQLSAERLQHKLGNKLEGADQALLQRSVDNIVTQVQAMQTLVNEFRDYARLPSAQMRPVDLNALAAEVLSLYGQAQDNGLLLPRLEPGLPLIDGDASQLRQVIHNLVQNALEAVADRPDGEVELITSTARGEQGELRAVRLTVIDNGPGFADKVLKRAFEPYVTTKAKGTGLGLAVVKKIADEHGARVRTANLHAGDEPDAPVTGARVSLSFSKFAAAALVHPANVPSISANPAPGSVTQQS